MKNSVSPQNENIEYSHHQLRFIPFAEHHISILTGWVFNEKEVVQWGGPDLTYPLGEAQFISIMAETRATPPGRLCWMVENSVGELFGHVQLVLDGKNGVAKVCRVIISPQMRGNGLAAPMVRMVLEKAFSYPGIERAELNVYTWNKAAVRVYSHIGFICEGVRRSSVKVGSERWDTAIMGILRDEWVAASAEPTDLAGGCNN